MRWLVRRVDKCVGWQVLLCDPANMCHTECFSGESVMALYKCPVYLLVVMR